jgi:hypothetical protein
MTLRATTIAMSEIIRICSLTAMMVGFGVGLGKGVGNGLCDGKGKNGAVFTK